MGAITDNPILLRRTNFLPELPYSACLGLDTVGSGMGQEEKLSKCGSLLGHLVYEECTLGVPASRHLSVSQEGSPGQRPHPGVLETSLSMGLSSGIPTVYILSHVIPTPPPPCLYQNLLWPMCAICHQLGILNPSLPPLLHGAYSLTWTVSTSPQYHSRQAVQRRQEKLVRSEECWGKQRRKRGLPQYA
jgi:hypothetical protein